MGVVIKVVLRPFSWLYTLITRFRNHLYDIGYRKSFEFQTCVVAVGNLSLGGNGKTPLIEYLVRLLWDHYQLATLSRGYGRDTKGFRLAHPHDTAATLGDEPYQLYMKFGQRITVAVGEARALAIPQILYEHPETEVVLLDDAFQHRSVRPQLNILVTDCYRPFFRDLVLPAGRLRERRQGAARAHLVVVTKCPEDLEEELRGDYIRKIEKYAGKVPVCFSTIKYHTPLRIIDKKPLDTDPSVLLFTGIANDHGLLSYVRDHYRLVKHFRFSDHHGYQPKDLKTLTRAFEQIDHQEKIMLTTEKDMVKLQAMNDLWDTSRLYYLPIEFQWLKQDRTFDSLVLNSIKRVQDSGL